MIFNIQQNIHIHSIKITSVGNSSVFQIGSAGIIKPLSQLANTGGYTEPAPQLESDFSLPTGQQAVILPPTKVSRN
ncbi:MULTISPECIES: spore germination protein GerPB [Bacillaceae]|uniref:Spore germination protein PB n=1 Tax=Peribacillus huizhouensis TaxID=1501239 RepID=A0ABR6CJI7_9BACI|nr:MULTISPECIES: spore germination protein GerPB [Bacillaceae]MBA9025231.1 spore germination protein PB [Peribacillus huizhouensis]